jgi:hypothetical protein
MTDQPIYNKGTGAGGANTNMHGKLFENKTNNFNNQGIFNFHKN